jgi:hypothetical protein
MLASTADRERALDVLKAGFAEGRLTQEEHNARAGGVHSARTYGDLAELTSDLPGGQWFAPPLQQPPWQQPPVPPVPWQPMPWQPAVPRTSSVASNAAIAGLVLLLVIPFLALLVAFASA